MPNHDMDRIDARRAYSPGDILHDQRSRLIEDVTTLAHEIGARNLFHYDGLLKAEDFVVRTFTEAGYEPNLQEYVVDDRAFANIIIEIPGSRRADEIVIVGAHYDSHLDSPGANDNGSSLAALFALARYFKDTAPSRTLRFVAFTNEERPFTRTEWMGSRVYARSCRRRGENIIAMISFETIGCYSEEEGSQRLSLSGRLLPSKGNFLALVGNEPSRLLLERVVGSLSLNSPIAFEAMSLPRQMPGTWSSDHWSFWQEKYPAIMVTDTAPLRYRPYHSRGDTAEKVNYEWLNKVVNGMKNVLTDLALPSDVAAIGREYEQGISWLEQPRRLSNRTLALIGVAALGLLAGAFLAKRRKRLSYAR